MERAHYFDQTPQVASKPSTVEINLADLSLTLKADRGVFSAERLDPGTKLLLNEVPPPPNDALVLDLGCGWGAIACVTALRNKSARIWAVDSNARARQLTEVNAATVGVADRVSVAAPQEVPEDVSFDRILSNPPIRIGKAALHQLLERWLSRLKPECQAYLVVQKHLGSDSLTRWLIEQRFSTIRLVSRSGYRILKVNARENS